MSVCPLSVVNTKIARSEDLGIWVTHKHRENLSESSNNWFHYYASNGLVKPTSVINTSFSGHAYQPYPHQVMCFLLMCTTILHKMVVNGWVLLDLQLQMQLSTQGMCSLQSSSLYMYIHYKVVEYYIQAGVEYSTSYYMYYNEAL